VIVAVAVLLPVRFVVLVVVADQIAQRESVMCRDEVDAGMGPRPLCPYKSLDPDRREGHFADQAAVALPEGANDIAILAVPFGQPPGN